MAFKVIPLPAGAMNLDKGSSAGDHMWVVKDATWQAGGYEKLPEWSSAQTQTVTADHLVRGAFCWRGGYTGRIYAATDNKFWEIADSSSTDVTGSTTPTNSTYGVTFASYGEWAFAANGVDKIQAIKVPSALGGTTNFADMVYTTNGAAIAPKYICSHKNHIIAGGITFKESWEQISTHTTGVGSGFTNQPNGTASTISVVSSAAGDTTQQVTIYGTYTGGGDLLRSETIALNGVVAVAGAYTTWQRILGVIITSGAAPAGNVTIKNTTGGTTIATITAGTLYTGVSYLAAADYPAGGRVLDIVASGASTQYLGFIGVDQFGTTLFDAQQLTGTTTVQSNNEFGSLYAVLIGNLGPAYTATITSHVYPAGFYDPYLVWWSGTDDPEGYGNEAVAPAIIGSSNQPLLDGVGAITGVVDGGDCFFVFKGGSIYRFDGPPFQPTIISHSVGMQHGNIPYRQGSRIYFWTDSGLSYIDINTNQIVNVMEGVLQRSITDYASANFGSVLGGYPESRSPVVVLNNAVNTSDVATICGDSVNSIVIVMYANASSPGAAGFIYHEKDKLFTLLTGPIGSNAEATYLVDYRSGSGQIPGLLSYIRLLYKADATTMRAEKVRKKGFSDDVTRDLYARWPDIVPQPGAPRIRVVKVRPVFMNTSTGVSASVTYAFKVEVISTNGVGRNWYIDSVYSQGSGTMSADGWVSVDGCPFADRHSIGFSVLGDGASGGSTDDPGFGGFVGIEVMVQEGPGKGI